MKADEGRLEPEDGNAVREVGESAAGVRCGLCGAAVEANRLSCAACGALLASVAGAAADVRTVSEAAVDAAQSGPMPPAEGVEEAVVAEAVGAEVQPSAPAAEPTAAAPPSTEPVAALPPGTPPASVPGSYVARWAVATPEFPRAVAAPPPAARTSPPSLAAMAAPAPAPAPSAAVASAASTMERRPAAGQAGLLADLPLDAPDDIPSWLVLIGSVVALASFVLPWASRDGIVLGTQGGSSYFDHWGLASLSDAALFLAALAMLGLAVVPNRLPLRFRFGYVPIVLGGMYLGVGWTYLGLSFGYGIGILVLLVGSIVLIAGSSMALRHPPAPPTV